MKSFKLFGILILIKLVLDHIQVRFLVQTLVLWVKDCAIVNFKVYSAAEVGPIAGSIVFKQKIEKVRWLLLNSI